MTEQDQVRTLRQAGYKDEDISVYLSIPLHELKLMSFHTYNIKETTPIPRKKTKGRCPQCGQQMAQEPCVLCQIRKQLDVSSQ